MRIAKSCDIACIIRPNVRVVEPNGKIHKQDQILDVYKVE